MTTALENLKSLYLDDSKHSHYQNVPEFLRDQIDISEYLTPTWRDDRCRLELISQYYSFNQIKTLSDIGANTGYFSLSLAKLHPGLQINAIEGNKNHVDFIRLVSEYAGIKNLKITQAFYDTSMNRSAFAAELVLYFNVLHHLGADHQKEWINLANFESEAIKCLRVIAKNCKCMAFQMGFNWGGNKEFPIISLEDDNGKIRYLERIMTAAGFRIDAFGLPLLNTKKDGFFYVSYPFSEASSNAKYEKLLKHHNVVGISEFFRRPIIFCSAD
jgi:hypothetical protein